MIPRADRFICTSLEQRRWRADETILTNRAMEHKCDIMPRRADVRSCQVDQGMLSAFTS